jgi:hypothetical protein
MIQRAMTGAERSGVLHSIMFPSTITIAGFLPCCTTPFTNRLEGIWIPIGTKTPKFPMQKRGEDRKVYSRDSNEGFPDAPAINMGRGRV